MLNHIQKKLAELCYLGCYIQNNDPFKAFEENLHKKLSNLHKPENKVTHLNYNEVIGIIEKTVVEKARATSPIILLSGGIDSTLIASILKKNKIDFKCYTYVLGKADPTLNYVSYVENKLGIKSTIIFYDKVDVAKVWSEYFKYYTSPTMDYASLVMADFINKISALEKASETYTFFDGMGADDLFGCGGLTNKNFYKAIALRACSNSFSNSISFDNRFLNIYTSSVINSIYANTLYQNYVFTKILAGTYFTSIRNYLASILLKNRSIKRNFPFGHSIMNLFYDGRRVAYKNSGFAYGRFDIFYPFLQDEVLNYGFRLENHLKISPYVKEPLKGALRQLGFDKSFVYAPKVGFIFNVFDIINIEEIIENTSIIQQVYNLRPGHKDFLRREYYRRTPAVDHFTFGLAMTQKYIQQMHTLSENDTKELQYC